MKQTATKEIAARIDEIQGKLNAGGNGHQTKALYDELKMLLDEYNTFDIVFEENGKKGLKDIAGRVRVPALYEDFTETFSYHWGRSMPVAARSAEGKYALVAADGAGTPLCDFEYDYISYLRATNSHYMCVKRSGDSVLKGVLDGKGRLIVPCEMDEVYEYAFNFTPFEKGGKYGCVTDNGTFVPPLYDELEADESWLKACKDGVWGYIAADCSFIPEDDEDRYDSEDFLSLYCEDDDCF
jgi:hypothetical protein